MSQSAARRSSRDNQRRLAHLSHAHRLEPFEKRVLLSGGPVVDASWFQTLVPANQPGGGMAAVVSGGNTGAAGQSQWIVQLTSQGVTLAGSVAGVAGVLGLGNIGGQVIEGLGLQGMVLVSAPGNGQSFSAVLAANPFVQFVQADTVIGASSIPTDPDFSAQWALDNTGQAGGTPGADINALAAWSASNQGAGVVIAEIDTGVDYTDPDLAGRIWTNPNAALGVNDGFPGDLHGYNFVDNTGDPMDDNGHGTNVAGIMAADLNNGIGVAGVAPRAQIMPLKFLNAAGQGSLDAAVRAIDYAIMMKTQYGVPVDVINASWAGSGYNAALYAAIAAAGQANILFVAAAGNGAADTDTAPSYPASYNLPNVISVAATDDNDQLAGFSDYGQASVDLGAPGVNILSTLPNGQFGGYTGTSMAAPFVAGVAALLFSDSPGASVQQVRGVILGSVDPDPSLAGLTVTGGRLDAGKAVALLASEGDPYEPNNSILAVNDATPGALDSPNLGQLNGPATISHLSITAGDDDYFRFVMPGTGSPDNSVTINFDHTLGQLDLQLYAADGTLLGTSYATGSDTQSLSLSGDPAGVYYVCVMGDSGQQNPGYSLTINPAPAPTPTPNLTLAITSDPLGGLILPGDTAAIGVQLANTGNGSSSGTAGVAIYLSTGVTIDSSAILLAQATGLNAGLLPGATRTLSLNVSVPIDLPLGTYNLLAQMTPAGGVAAAAVAGDVAVSDKTHELVWMVGQVSGRRVRRVQLLDANGNAFILTLSGDGSAQISGDGSAQQIVLTGTSDNSVLTITPVVPNTPIELGGLIAQGAMAAIRAPEVDLSGSLTIEGGAGSIRLGDLGAALVTLGASDVPANLHFNDVTDVSINSGQDIAALTVNSWSDTDGQPDVVTAPRVASLRSAGDFDAGLSLSGSAAGVTLGRAGVGGSITGGAWNVVGAVGSIVAVNGIDAAWSLTAAAGVARIASGLSGLAGDVKAQQIGSIHTTGTLSAAIAVTGLVSSVVSSSWSDGSLTAGSLGRAYVAGNLTGVTVTILNPPDPSHPRVNSLGTLWVGGSADQLDLSAVGSVGAVSAGAMGDSQVSVGAAAGSQSIGQGVQSAGGGSTLQSLTVRGLRGVAGPSFTGSDVTAPIIGVVRLQQVDTASGSPYGITADDVGLFSRLDGAAGKKRLVKLSEAGLADEAGTFYLTVL